MYSKSAGVIENSEFSRGGKVCQGEERRVISRGLKMTVKAYLLALLLFWGNKDATVKKVPCQEFPIFRGYRLTWRSQELTCEALQFRVIHLNTTMVSSGRKLFNEVSWQSVRLLGHGFLKNNHKWYLQVNLGSKK